MAAETIKRSLIVGFACIAVWAAFLPARGVWAPDEARYAEVAREMALEGRWLVPVLNGELYAEKPPLFFVLVRLISLPFGEIPEWAVKVPSLAGGALALLCTALIGARLMGADGAWLAPLLLGTMFKFAWQAQFGQIDMWLAGLVTAQLALGLRALAGQDRRWTSILSLAGLAFLGILSKGLPGAALPWLILAAYGAARRDWAGLARLGLQWVILLAAALGAVWLAGAGLAAGWDYPASLVLKQSVERALSPWHHQAPWYYFLGIFWSDGLPYSLLLVPMIAPLIRRRTWQEPGALLPLVWMAVYLLVFSLSGGKRSVYILPLFPAMALLLAHGLASFQLQRWPAKGLSRVLLFLSAFFPALFVAALLLARPKLEAALPWLATGTACLTAGAVSAWALSRRGRVLDGAVGLAAACLLFEALSLWPLARRLDETKVPKAVVAQVAPVLQRGGILAVYPNLVPSVNYYARTLTTVYKKDQRPSALAFLNESPDHLILAEGSALQEKPLEGTQAILQTSIGQDTFYLLKSGAAP